MNKTKCKCETCKLARMVKRIARRCVGVERDALNTLWCRMEDAETALAMGYCKAWVNRRSKPDKAPMAGIMAHGKGAQ